MRSLVDYELPRDDVGRTYITDVMLAEDDDGALRELLDRTRNSWWRDELAYRYVLFPTGGKNG